MQLSQRDINKNYKDKLVKPVPTHPAHCASDGPSLEESVRERNVVMKMNQE